MSKEKVDKLRKTICRKNREALQMKTEIKRLREENERLRNENEQQKVKIERQQEQNEEAICTLFAEDAEKKLLQIEIERLREENECFEAMQAGVEIRIADLNADNNRLLGLLKECQPYLAVRDTRGLWGKIIKEVGDE